MRLLVTSLVFLSLVIAAGCSRDSSREAGRPGAASGDIRWHTYLDMARREAARDHHSILAVFYARECPGCKAMDDSVFANPEVRDLMSGLVNVRIALEADSAVVDSLHVREHPTTVFLDEEGRELDRIIGYTAPAAFLARARNILAGRQGLEAMLAQEPVHRADPPFLLELGQKLYSRRDYEGALRRLEAAVTADPANRAQVADRALFLTGRILTEQSRFQESIVPLDRLIKEFPASPLIPDAHVYRAVALLSIRGRNQEGVNELQDVLVKYPNTRAASWAREQLTILAEKRPAGDGTPAARPGSAPAGATPR